MSFKESVYENEAGSEKAHYCAKGHRAMKTDNQQAISVQEEHHMTFHPFSAISSPNKCNLALRQRVFPIRLHTLQPRPIWKLHGTSPAYMPHRGMAYFLNSKNTLYGKL